MSLLRPLGFLVLALVASTLGRADEPFFMGLGDLPGGVFDSRAHAVSADGRVVVGVGNDTTGWHALRWLVSGGMSVLCAQGLGQAFDISPDASIIVGECDAGGFNFLFTVFTRVEQGIAFR